MRNGPGVHRFGDFELDSASGELLRGGEPVPLQARPLALLRYLVEHRGRTVPKRELADEVWSGVAVSDSAVTSALRDVRRALGDDGRSQSWLRTVRGRGVRFVGEVEARQGWGPAVGPQSGAPFVGRERELGELRQSLETAVAGRGGIVLLAGEAGIGKTRLAQELGAIAEAEGFAFREVGCTDDPGAPAFWPWVQLVRAEWRTRGRAGIESLIGGGVADLARLVPEFEEAATRRDPNDVSEDPQQFRMLDDLARLVHGLATEQPLFLLLEDLHCADSASLRALDLTAHEIQKAPVLVLGTYRAEELDDDHPLHRAHASLLHSSGYRRLELEGLSADESAQLVGALSDGADLPLHSIWERTAGNPFFVIEVVRQLREGGGQTSISAVPAGVRAVIERGLSGLSTPANRCVLAASLVGRDFALSVIERVCGLDRSALMDALREAQARGFLRPQNRGHNRYEFNHDLLRDTARENISSAERAHIHDGIARALEESRPHDPATGLEVAGHLLQAARHGADAMPALEAACRAYEKTRERGAYEDAAQQAENALEALDLAGEADDRRRCDLLIGLTEARIRSGRGQDALGAAREAAELARSLGDPSKFGQAVLLHAERTVVDGFRDDETLSLLEDALAALGDGYESLRVRLLAVLANHLRAGGEEERAEAIMSEAVEQAESRDPGLRVFVLKERLWHRWADGPHELLAMATELRDQSERLGLVETAAMAEYFRLHAFLCLGDPDGADQEFSLLLRRIERARLLQLAWIAPAYRGCRALLEGRLAEAEQAAVESFETRRRDATLAAQSLFFAQLFAIRRVSGQLEELLGLLEANTDALAGGVGVAIALADAELGRHDEALRELDRWAEHDFKTKFRIANEYILAGLSKICILTESRPHAAQLYERLLPRAGIILAQEIYSVEWSVSLLLGGLARIMEAWDDAENHFETALEQLTTLKAHPLLAEVRCDYARMLFERGAKRDRARASKLLEQSIATARELGMATLLARAEALQAEGATVVPLDARRKKQSTS